MGWAKRQIEDDLVMGLPKKNDKPFNFGEYRKVYEKFWSKKKSVTPSDIEFMVKLIEERATKCQRQEKIES